MTGSSTVGVTEACPEINGTCGNYNAPTTTDNFGNGITARSIGVHENLVCVILSNDNVGWGSNGRGEIGDEHS